MNTLNWTNKELKTLEEIPGLTFPMEILFEKISDVSLDNILSLKMGSKSKEVWGISTPYTTGGYGIEINTRIFNECMYFLEKNNMKVFNFPVLDVAIKPLRIKWCEENKKNYCALIFDITYNKIFQFADFNGIFRTPIWQSSDGCKKEDGIFKSFGIPVYKFPGYKTFIEKKLNFQQFQAVP